MLNAGRNCLSADKRSHMERLKMDKDLKHVSERILNLTLEIIYHLTGESFPPVKSGDQVTIMVPPCDLLTPERHNMEKILEVTQKMIGVLTGEVSGGFWEIIIQ
ncbi:gastrula zinc finger protein XlCGF53.1-like [Mantella aurantiaca]